MKIKIALLVLIIAIFAVIIAFFFIPKDQNEPTEVTIGMAYIPSVQFAPWYVAQEKGFFAQEDLKVNFDYRMDVDALQLAGSDKIDFAIAGGDQVLTARSQNIPVVYLLSLYAKFPPTIVALSDSGIKSPQDLIGKKLGMPLYGTNLLAAKVILHQAGVDESKVDLIDIGYTQTASLLNHKVDAVVGFANNEPIKISVEGKNVNCMNSWEYFDLVGHGLITGENQIKNNPKTVRKMVRATQRAMEYCIKNPDEAFELSVKYLPELDPTKKEIEKQVFLESMQMWQNDYTEKKGIGHFNRESWEKSQQLIYELKLIEKTTPIDKMINQSFLY